MGQTGEANNQERDQAAQGSRIWREMFDALKREMAEQHEALAERLLESTKETKQALETLADNVARHEKAIVANGEAIPDHMAVFMRKIEALEHKSFRQHEALAALSRMIEMQHPLPATRGWAASPDLLLYLYELILQKNPAVVVELGGGVSSLVIAAALKANGRGHLYSFDHERGYAARTAALLGRERFAEVASIEHAPLSSWISPTPNGLAESWNWYTLPKNVLDIAAIDLLVVDGPPEKTGPYARYPALPALVGRLAPDATILLDDTAREAEATIAKIWRDEFDLDLTLHSDFEKGLAVLTRTKKMEGKRGGGGFA